MCAEDGYPLYRRRFDHQKVHVRKATLDNRWVVPYNPYLLTRYNCHINVEICSGIKAVKYLYKVAVYIAHPDGEAMVDEIQLFQDARWVSAQEAIWRIFEFNLNEMSPAVINLQVHLPGKQCVTYWKNQNLKNLLQWDHVSKTMLTEFFNFNRRNQENKRYLYKEFPEHYVWDKKDRCWNKRKKGEVIGRINGANPAEGERYYLRLLLNHVRGPQSYGDLLTVDGVRCSTFKESAQKRGILESDNSIFDCMNEAVAFKMPHALRRLFATLLVYCQPTNVRKLWDNYFQPMAEDYRRNG
ncbi:uncharacterized protein LOC113766278 [Coffea eugenioides]|uniref:uncharacterized protein LOC113766278 n=1 Tax=Coffea eugenioides TaxID=49369 RepID=UPI000F60BAFE|nr:uncharacterized protein LOC113766278 [Coffea eugenioides]